MTDPSNEPDEELNRSPWEGVDDPVVSGLDDLYVDPWPKPSSGPLNYIANHWRGDLSLAKSYWINTLLLSLPFTILLSSLESLALTIRTMEQQALFFWTLAFLTVFAFPLTAWQLIGTWRSATKRTVTTGKSGWSSVAKVVMVIAWIQVFGAFGKVTEDWPAYKEIAAFTLGLNPMGDYNVTVIDGGTGIGISGAIARGVVDEVRSALARAEEPIYVGLESNGGRIGVGDSLNRLIRNEGLATLVKDNCYSACALAFLGGQSRVLAEGALIGFHQSSSGLEYTPTVRAMELSADELQRTIMREAGLPEWFIDKAMKTPSTQMWTPSAEVFAKAGVITHTLKDGELELAQ